MNRKNIFWNVFWISFILLSVIIFTFIYNSMVSKETTKDILEEVEYGEEHGWFEDKNYTFQEKIEWATQANHLEFAILSFMVLALFIVLFFMVMVSVTDGFGGGLLNSINRILRKIDKK